MFWLSMLAQCMNIWHEYLEFRFQSARAEGAAAPMSLADEKETADCVQPTGHGVLSRGSQPSQTVR
jgi:hypothetical protein